MTPQEKLYAITQALLNDGDLEVKVDGSPVVEVTLVESGNFQDVLLGCANGRSYPAEIVNLAEKLGTLTATIQQADLQTFSHLSVR